MPPHIVSFLWTPTTLEVRALIRTSVTISVWSEMGWCWVPSWLTHSLRADIPGHTSHTNLGGSDCVRVESWGRWSPNPVKVKCKRIWIIITLYLRCLCELCMPPGYLSIKKQSKRRMSPFRPWRTEAPSANYLPIPLPTSSLDREETRTDSWPPWQLLTVSLS